MSCFLEDVDPVSSAGPGGLGMGLRNREATVLVPGLTLTVIPAALSGLGFLSCSMWREGTGRDGWSPTQSPQTSQLLQNQHFTH